MFGYVKVNKEELKMKDYYKYKAYYCGLCKNLKNKYGPFGQMTLTYDMTFLIILLTSLYESNTVRGRNRCMVHPVKKHDILCNEITEYAADMNIALTYHHFLDDWEDEKSVVGLAGTKILKRDYMKVCKQYPRQCNAIKKCLNFLLECETKKEMNLDLVSGCFGELMEELLVYRQDMWEEKLRKIGFFLGKFIYIMDAYEDRAKDVKQGNYNPLCLIYETETYETECKNILTMMMAECTGEFEKLPCIIDIDILRNILYVGVWSRYDTIKNEKSKKEGTES